MFRLILTFNFYVVVFSFALMFLARNTEHAQIHESIIFSLKNTNNFLNYVKLFLDIGLLLLLLLLLLLFIHPFGRITTNRQNSSEHRKVRA